MKMLILAIGALAAAWTVSRVLRSTRRRDDVISNEALKRWEDEGGAVPSGAQTGGSQPTL